MTCREKPEFEPEVNLNNEPSPQWNISEWTYAHLKTCSPSERCLAELATHLGYNADYPPDGSYRDIAPCYKRIKFIKYVDTIATMVDDQQVLTTLLDTHPSPYPTERPMNPKLAQRMAICGRRFEIMQLTITIQACDCCGCVVPHASDPWYKSQPSPTMHSMP